MIPLFPISVEIRDYIRAKLAGLAEAEGVRILLAVESGSRAWGFPSTDSDYDVRFIYVRPRDAYLSIKNYRDVIETPLVMDDFLGVPFDLNGWDIRKALQLGLKSNAVLLEWLVSPARYDAEESALRELLAFATSHADMEALKYHYHRLAGNAWKQLEENVDNVQVKRYCYALRPALALAYIRRFKEVPPMDIATLAAKTVDDASLKKEIATVITLKSTEREGDTIPRSALLDAFITEALKPAIPRPAEAESDCLFSLQEADGIFQRIINDR